MTPERASELLAECGYAARERRVVGDAGTVRYLSATMTEAEYDYLMGLWAQKKRGSFNDVLRDVANKEK
ncbi:MAG: hypothetical protein ACRCSL_16625 [Microbacterium sp.]